MTKMVDEGMSTKDIMTEIDSRNFSRAYWMMVYKKPEDPIEKKEAKKQLKRLMLVNY